MRLKDWHSHRDSTLGDVLLYATTPPDTVTPSLRATLAAAAAEPRAAAADATASTSESDADGGYADSRSGFSPGSSAFEAETAASYAEGKRDRSIALDAIQVEIASAVDRFRPRARYRAAIGRLEAAVSLLSEWMTTHRFGPQAPQVRIRPGPGPPPLLGRRKLRAPPPAQYLFPAGCSALLAPFSHYTLGSESQPRVFANARTRAGVPPDTLSSGQAPSTRRRAPAPPLRSGPAPLCI